MADRWCVKDRQGWCAVADDTEPREGTTWVPTLCGLATDTGIVLPWGFDHREPVCPDCVALLSGVPTEEASDDD